MASQTDSSFDPTGAVRFDLEAGSASDADGGRLVLVPSEALDLLGSEALAAIGLVMGTALGARIAARLGGDSGVRSSSLEVAVAHLAGELAVAGVGAVHVERWGRAMVAIVTNPSIGDDAFVGAVLAGALSGASGREIAAAALGRENEQARFFLGSAATVARAEELVASGKAYAEVVAILQGGSS